jgi:hypothetical protein
VKGLAYCWANAYARVGPGFMEKASQAFTTPPSGWPRVHDWMDGRIGILPDQVGKASA